MIRFEALQAGFDAVYRRIGKHPCRLPHINTTSHRPYADYLCAESRALFARHFARDNALLGYGFDQEG